MSPKSLFAQEKAEKLAKMMKTNDPEWDYIVVPSKETGYFFIEVYDERKHLIGSV